MSVLEMDAEAEASTNLVGPVIRSGDLAEAVIDAIEEDNPDTDVLVLDRDDYVRIHTVRSCRLTQASLEKYYGQAYKLAALEIDMPSFKGRLYTRDDEYRWYYENEA
ncbi:MmoB/DmpM family protein [Gordonia sp. OPL2]|uniref:MmoB/DmpM family protein n=1 Tax=Gordonia sp. OPL2 TaxID=2486274 RepID=UPI0016553512|nr:MmoB/DmpM family protein [Gordonia sp. OPL2]ROZ88017.1 monooxygenase [Gordonia sp. OPL2]